MKVIDDHSIRLMRFLIHAFFIMIILVFAFPDEMVSQSQDKKNQTIKIGLLVPDAGSIAAVNGAELAIRRANEKGGLNGRQFQLVTRSMEGPWGTGSKQAVNLIFEEKVWALLGSHDGRNAHLVEQAATRSIVVFVSAWTSDPTLSQAFVPWFFNCVPNDNQQAASIIEEIYNVRKFNRIAVVSGNDYDSKMTLIAFVKLAKTSGKPDPVQFNYNDYSKNLNDLTDVINKSDINYVVLFCKPQEAIKVIRQIRQRKMDQAVFGSLMLLNEDELSAGELQEFDDKLSVPSGNWTGPGNMSFRQEFQKSFKKIPGMVASYSYDGMSVLIEAIRNAGRSDREMIQKSLERIYLKGVTGLIQFDGKGNRLGKFEIMKTKNGVPASSE
jgi:branched-chain amino acid transport system substrate-binding protein